MVDKTKNNGSLQRTIAIKENNQGVGGKCSIYLIFDTDG